LWDATCAPGRVGVTGSLRRSDVKNRLYVVSAFIEGIRVLR
jgi:hypothetical protein